MASPETVAAANPTIAESALLFRLVAHLPPLSSPHFGDALAFAVEHGINTVILPAVSGSTDVQKLAMLLRLEEARCGITDGDTRIVALLDAGGLLKAQELLRCSHRLVAIALDKSWSDLDAHSQTMAFARSQLVLAARAGGIDAIAPALKSQDMDIFRSACTSARAGGFSGMFVENSDRARIVNGIF